MPGVFRALLLLGAFAISTASAQTSTTPRAILADGDGPWRDDRWNLAVTEFSSLLTDAGYAVSTVSPVDLPSALGTSDILLAVPSLESLPLATFNAISAHIAAGGSLMASGGEPFRAALRLTSDGQWVEAAIGPNLLLNGSFENPLNGDWKFGVDLNQGAAATIERTDSTAADGVFSAHISVTSPAQFNNVQFWQGGLSLQQGSDYTLRFSAKANAARIMHVNVLKDGGDYHNYGLSTDVNLEADWQGYVVNFKATETVEDGRVNFYFGDQAGDTWLDNVILAPLQSAESFTAPVIETLSPSYKQYVTQYAGQTVRVPIARGRGLSATPDPDGRYRVVGDLLKPAATRYGTTNGTVIIWLPWPRLSDPERAQLVAMLSAAHNRLYILNAGPTQFVTLPTESVTLGATVINAATSSVQANLHWAVSALGAPPGFQSDTALTLTAGKSLMVPALNIGKLPPGSYTVSASLRIGGQEIDRLDSSFRVFDPTLTHQPDQRIRVLNGSFLVGDHRVFLQGVNYWPRYWPGLETGRFITPWLSPQNYDPDVIEADLSLLASLHFNLVSIAYYFTEDARQVIDFLERCRNHGMWANIAIPAEGSFRSFIPFLQSTLQAGYYLSLSPRLTAAFLPGNDRVFAYDLAWEPTMGSHDDRLPLDDAWRSWLTDQYGSPGAAEKVWAFAAPRDAKGQLSNPLDDQIANDGPWRVMVAAYRRFADDYLSRIFGAASRQIRHADSGALLSFRNWGASTTDSTNRLMNFDRGTAAAHLDFLSSEGYGIPWYWPGGRAWGFDVAYRRYRSGGKPVYWAEYGWDIGPNGGSSATRANQNSICDTMMNLVSDTGSGAASVWWMPGGWRLDEQSDLGILNPDGSPRDCALTLAQWGATFAATPPDQGSGDPVTLTVDRDADARGQYGLFLRWQDDYIQARQAGRPVALIDAGTGTDTSTMPIIQVGNVPYAGSGPLKYANGEFAGIHVTCPGVDVTVENDGQVQATAGLTCQITPTLVNTGSAAWLPGAQQKGGVTLHTNLSDLPLKTSVASLQRTDMGPLQVTIGQNPISVTGRLSIQGVGPFGETLNLSLVGK